MDCYDSQYCDEDCDNCELAKKGGWSPEMQKNKIEGNHSILRRIDRTANGLEDLNRKVRELEDAGYEITVKPLNDSQTPYKRAVHMIIHSIINLEDKYVLDGKFVRWGRVEKDLWELERLAFQQAVQTIKEKQDAP